jgi:hypothetical protein
VSGSVQVAWETIMSEPAGVSWWRWKDDVWSSPASEKLRHAVARGVQGVV